MTRITREIDWKEIERASRCREALLNGWWEFEPLRGDADLARLPSEYTGQILVPSFWNTATEEVAGTWGGYHNFEWGDKWNDVRAAAYRREFDLPRRPAATALRMRFDAVLAGAEVRLNGNPVLQIDDGFLPHEIDITELARWGEANTLELLVRERPVRNGCFMRPCGSWLGWQLLGIWQDCSLRLEPAVRIDDVFIQPSVREHALRVTTTVENTTGQPVQVAVAHKVAGGPALFRSGTVEIGPLTTTTLDAEIPWEKAKLWSPEAPNLYWLKSTLRVSGKAVDVRENRFGFKEFWIDGTNFVLNGTPIRLRGDSWHYLGAVMQSAAYARTWFEMVKSIGANAVRLHAMPYPPFFLDAADEAGICIVDESAVYGSGGNLALDDEEFWEHARIHVKRLVRRDRNHPSICLWSATNEVVWKGGPAVFPHLLSLQDAIREEDGTRPVSFDENQSDLGGGASIYAGHYGSVGEWTRSWKKEKPLIVHEYSCLYYSGPEEPARWGGEACFADFNARTRAGGEEAREMTLGLRGLGAASVTPWNFVWYGLWPAYPAVEVELQPEPAAPGIKTMRIGPHSASLNYDLPTGVRLEPGADRTRPNAAFAPMRSAYAPVGAFVREQNNNFYSGTTITRHVDVFNDVPAAAVLKVELSLGRDVIQVQEVELPPAGQALLRFELQVPVTAGVKRLLLRVRTSRKRKRIHEAAMPCWIAPRKIAFVEKAAPKLAVVDGDGATIRLLRELGYDCETVDAAALDSGNPGGVIVIGRNELQGSKLAGMNARLTNAGFFSRGGVMLVLEGAFGEDATSPLNPVVREYHRAWRRGASDFWKVIQDDESLWCWAQDGSTPPVNSTVVKRVFRKPRRGEFLPLAEVADGGDGLEFSPLLWLPLGTGGVFLNSFELVANAALHPVPALLLCRLLDCAAAISASGGASVAPPVSRAVRGFASQRRRKTVVLAAGDSLLREFSTAAGVLAVEDRRARSAGVVIVDASSEESMKAAEAGAIADALNRGATVVLVDAGDSAADAIARISGVRPRFHDESLENVAKADGKALAPELAGISNDDLVWVRRGQSELICERTIEPDPRIEPLIVTVPTRWAGYAESAEQHKYAKMLRCMEAFDGTRIALGAIRVGRGNLVLSQLRLHKSRLFPRKASRVWSLLQRNLGASFHADASPLVDTISPFTDESAYIRRWMMLGVFGGVEPSALLSHDFVRGESALRPEPGSAEAGHLWFVHDANEPGVNLRVAFEGQLLNNVACYAGVYVFSPTSRDILLDTPDMVDLMVGSDDGVRAWLNGEPVLQVDAMRPWVPDEDRISGVRLRKGWNLLVLKVAQRGWDWRMSARFLTSRGMPVSGLRYGLKPE